MKFMTRPLRAAAFAALAVLAAGAAHAQWKPTKPVDLIVHTGPGGGSDLLARAIATMMEKENVTRSVNEGTSCVKSLADAAGYEINSLLCVPTDQTITNRSMLNTVSLNGGNDSLMSTPTTADGS